MFQIPDLLSYPDTHSLDTIDSIFNSHKTLFKSLKGDKFPDPFEYKWVTTNEVLDIAYKLISKLNDETDDSYVCATNIISQLEFIEDISNLPIMPADNYKKLIRKICAYVFNILNTRVFGKYSKEMFVMILIYLLKINDITLNMTDIELFNLVKTIDCPYEPIEENGLIIGWESFIEYYNGDQSSKFDNFFKLYNLFDNFYISIGSNCEVTKNGGIVLWKP